MFGPSAGNIATAFIAEQTRLEGTRLRNAQAWQEFRRNNPTATLEEMSTFADNISGGDSWLRGQFPAGEVLRGIAEQNDARRADDDVRRRADASDAQERLNTNIERTYGRNLFSTDNDVDALENTYQQFGGDNPQNRAIVQRTIAGLGNPEAVRQRFISQSIAQYGPAAVEAFRGGGEAAVNNQFSNLPEPIRLGLINNARGVITREDEDRALRRDQAYAAIDSSRAGAESYRANTATSRAALSNGLITTVQGDLAVAAAIAEGDQTTANNLIRQRMIANGQQPDDASVAQLYSLAETNRGVRVAQEYQARVAAVRQQAARLEDPELITENRNLVKATVAPFTAAIRNETWRRQVGAAMEATAATLYMTPAQANAAVRFIAEMPNDAKPEDLVSAAQAAARSAGAQPLRAGTQAIRDSFVRNSVGEAPMRAPAYVNGATSALDQSASNFNTAIATARSQPNGQAQFDREIQAYRNHLQAERAALNTRFATRGTWSTSTFTEQQRDAVAARIDQLETQLNEVAAAPFQSDRRVGAATGPSNQAPGTPAPSALPQTPGPGARRDDLGNQRSSPESQAAGATNRPGLNARAQARTELLRQYNSNEIDGATYAVRLREVEKIPITGSATRGNRLEIPPLDAVLPGGAAAAAAYAREISSSINPDTGLRLAGDVAIRQAATRFGVTEAEVRAALIGRPRQ